MITEDHIDYITKDLSLRGIIVEGFHEEMIDHVCSAVEEEMAKGRRFIDAYDIVLKTFGSTRGLRQTQQETIRAENPKATIMLRNYLTIGWRNLQRQKFYTMINVFGLAVGIASCLIIALYIIDELSYDKYNLKADRIYRIEASVKIAANEFDMTYRSAPEAQALRELFPEIESTVRFRQSGTYLVRAADAVENIKETNVIWADSTFFKIFSVNVLEGNPSKALAEPNAIAISKKIANKYFKGKSALGQTMILDNRYNAKITAVYDDMPSASHFHFDIIFSMLGDWPIAREARQTNFIAENFITYILLKKGSDVNTLREKLPTFLEQHLAPELAKTIGPSFNFKEFLASGNRYNLSLIPILDIHLHSNKKGEFEQNGSIASVYLFAAIGIIILVIACINFMNLSTARSGNRAKEVGVRKVMGSLRSHLVKQFLTESFIITGFAVLLGVGMAYLMLPLFNELAQKQLIIPFNSILFFLSLATVCLVVGLIAGFYPSFILSSFKIVNVLKGQSTIGGGSAAIRSALVVFQFMISIFLIIGALTVNRQLSYIQHKDLGFQKDQMIIVHDGYALRNATIWPNKNKAPSSIDAFKQEVLQISGIEAGTVSGFVPVDTENSWRNSNTFWRDGVEPTPENIVSFQAWSGDYDYINTFQMKIKDGRNFSRDFPSDKSAVILNQTAVRQLGLTDPLGKKIKQFAINGVVQDSVPALTIIGVIEDFHFSTMKETIVPLALTLDDSDGSITFRFQSRRAEEVVSAIESIWKKLAPGQPFFYTFLDQDFERMYLAEQRLGRIFILFAALAIVIACLGLFALTAFAAQQRTREIGIRKVLGASVNSIVILLSRQFGKLVFVSFIIAAPSAYFAIDWWLSGYSYRTSIGFGVYAIAGILAFLIALATMSFQSIKAALSNPVKSLRNE